MIQLSRWEMAATQNMPEGTEFEHILKDGVDWESGPLEWCATAKNDINILWNWGTYIYRPVAPGGYEYTGKFDDENGDENGAENGDDTVYLDWDDGGIVFGEELKPDDYYNPDSYKLRHWELRKVEERKDIDINELETVGEGVMEMPELAPTGKGNVTLNEIVDKVVELADKHMREREDNSF